MPVFEVDMDATDMTITLTYEQALRDLVRVLNAAHDRRITQTTLDFWRGHPDKAGIVIAIERLSSGLPISVSACQYTPYDRKTHRTFTATLPQYRRQGHGEKALRNKLEQLALANILYKTTVAADNEPSINMLKKVGLKLATTKVSNKADGTPFKQCTFVSENPNDVEPTQDRSNRLIHLNDNGTATPDPNIGPPAEIVTSEPHSSWCFCESCITQDRSIRLSGDAVLESYGEILIGVAPNRLIETPVIDVHPDALEDMEDIDNGQV